MAAEEARQAHLPAHAERPERWHVLNTDERRRLLNIGALLHCGELEQAFLARRVVRLIAEPWRNLGVLAAFDVVAACAHLEVDA